MIIGKPPHKQGPTFADVPIATEQSLFHAGTCAVWCRVTMDTAHVLGKPDLRKTFRPDEPVTPLRTEPVEPGTAPGVTTYGELEPGRHFVFPDTPSILRERVAIERSHRSAKATGCRIVGARHWAADDRVCRWGGSEPVRPVPTSVVVHEEPGEYVRGDGGVPSVRLFAGTPWVVIDRACLERIVSQGAAWLHSFAQRDAEQVGEGSSELGRLRAEVDRLKSKLADSQPLDAEED